MSSICTESGRHIFSLSTSRRNFCPASLSPIQMLLKQVRVLTSSTRTRLPPQTTSNLCSCWEKQQCSFTQNSCNTEGWKAWTWLRSHRNFPQKSSAKFGTQTKTVPVCDQTAASPRWRLFVGSERKFSVHFYSSFVGFFEDRIHISVWSDSRLTPTNTTP